MSQDQDLELYPALLGRTHENLFVGDEKPADFYALLNSLLERYLPDSGHVRALVEDAAIARWHLWRRQRSSIAASRSYSPPNPTNPTPANG